MVIPCKGLCSFFPRYQRSRGLHWRVALVFIVCMICAFVITKYGSMNRLRAGRRKEIAYSSTERNGINDKYNRCLWMNISENSDILIPDDHLLLNFSVVYLSCLFQRYVTTLQVLCTEPKRFGDVGFGGFRLCSDYDVKPKLGCMIITNHLNISQRFIKQTRAMYNCSIMYQNRAKSISGLSEIESSLNIYRNQISVLILQLTRNDFQYLPEFAKRVASKRVHQVIVEIHHDKSNHTEIMSLLQFFRHLYQSSFRIYWFERNFEFVHEERPSCFTVNLYYIATLKMSVNSDTDSTSKSEGNYLPNVAPIGTRHIERNQKIEYHNIATRYFSKHQILCREIVRLGKTTDGGWEVCHDVRFRPKPPCVIYSFGTDFDFSFDADMVATYGCEVYSFDPFMGMDIYLQKKSVKFFDIGISDKNEHIKTKTSTAKLMTLQSIMRKFGHIRKSIDVLKIDINGNEMQTLVEMIESNVLSNIRQFYIKFYNYYDVGALRKLYDIGFRIFWSHQNPYRATYTRNETFSPVMELYFLNINSAQL